MECIAGLTRSDIRASLAMSRGITASGTAWLVFHNSFARHRKRVSITNSQVVDNCAVLESDETRNYTIWAECRVISVKRRGIYL